MANYPEKIYIEIYPETHSGYEYTKDYEYIGMFECRDVGGHYKLRNGTAIDVFRDDMESALDWVHTYGDYVYVVWIPAEG